MPEPIRYLIEVEARQQWDDDVDGRSRLAKFVGRLAFAAGMRMLNFQRIDSEQSPKADARPSKPSPRRR